MDKDVVHIYNGILLIYQKNIMPFVTTWMQLEILILSEAKSEREKTNTI